MIFGGNLANLTAGKAKVILDCNLMKVVTMPGVGPGFASTLCAPALSEPQGSMVGKNRPALTSGDGFQLKRNVIN